ncbi:hypothetical protein SUDANB145_05524 [Streptomyces sp. enrichment culture]
MYDTAAPADAAVRTWFHAVHSRTYLGQYAVASVLSGSSRASASLRGTLAAM